MKKFRHTHLRQGLPLHVGPRLVSSVLLVFMLVLVLARPGAVSAATLSLSPQARLIKPGETFSVDVLINTKGESVTFADVYFTHDKTLLEAITVTNGTFFPNTYHVLTPGEPYISGALSKSGESYTGTGKVATITFKALKEGVDTMAFKCTPGKTADTNIARLSDGSDIVECSALVNGVYTISNSATPDAAATPTPNSLPQAGSIGNTLMFVGLGILLTIVGIVVIL